MQDNSGAENSASARKALARAQRVLQVVTAKRSALALRDVREVLEECLKTEASSLMKVIGYRILAKQPTCLNHDAWNFVLESCVMELAGSQNAPVLTLSIPILEQIPLPLVLGFLVSTEKEPMNKLRAILSHEDIDVRCCAIGTLSRITLEIAASITNGGLMVFPFESHEARICCQQDVWTMVIDVWKIIFQTLLLSDVHLQDAAGAAFASMRMLFARTSAMAHFFSLTKTHSRNQAAMNDIASALFRDAYPLARTLIDAVRKLPMKYQATGAVWIATLLYTMMERTGARCPSVSVPYLSLDVVSAGSDNLDQDESDTSSTERVRIDQLVAEQLESWMIPLLSSKTSLSQSSSICRAIFILLSHPMQEFSRLPHSATLVNHMTAQCAFSRNSATKLEFAQMLVRVFSWLSSAGWLVWFTRTVDAVFLVDREADRNGLLSTLMAVIVERVRKHRDFQLLESICAIESLTQGGLKLTQGMVLADVFRALVQAAVNCEDRESIDNTQAAFGAQLIILKVFKAALTPKSPAASSDLESLEFKNKSSMLRNYMTLMTAHFLQGAENSVPAFQESLDYFRNDCLKIWRQIPSLRARLQLLSIGIYLVQEYQLVPPQLVLDAIKYEVAATFTVSSDQDSDGGGGGGTHATATMTAFDDGKLGSGSTTGGAVLDFVTGQERWTNVDAVTAIVECLKHMARIYPPATSQLAPIFQQMHVYATRSCPVILPYHHILEQQLQTSTDGTKGFFTQSIMNPYSALHPEMEKWNSHTEPTESWRSVKTITGCGDPLAIQFAYYQPSDASLDVVVLQITCSNLTSLSLSDFELRVCPIGDTAKSVDIVNDFKARVLQAGGSASSNLLPFGTVRVEKRFQLCKFTQASFLVQVAFMEAESSEQPSTEQVPLQLAVSDRFTVSFDALLLQPASQYATASFFQWQWQSAEATMVLPIHSTGRTDSATTSSEALSLCQRVIKRQSIRVAVVAELLVDLPFFFHVAILSKSRWDDFVAISLTLTQSSGKWSGSIEIRSTAANTRELEKFPTEVLELFGGGYFERLDSNSTDMSAISDAAVSGAHTGAFEHGKAAPTSAFSFTPDFPVETRQPQSVDAVDTWAAMQSQSQLTTTPAVGAFNDTWD